jgi:hypothetical protein
MPRIARGVIDRSMQPCMPIDLALSALLMTIWRSKPKHGNNSFLLSTDLAEIKVTNRRNLEDLQEIGIITIVFNYFLHFRFSSASVANNSSIIIFRLGVSNNEAPTN